MGAIAVRYFCGIGIRQLIVRQSCHELSCSRRGGSRVQPPTYTSLLDTKFSIISTSGFCPLLTVAYGHKCISSAPWCV